MNGQADKIARAGATLEERGIPADSFFEVEFADGTTITEKDVNWSAMSHEARVGYFGATKSVFLCTQAIRRIGAHHGALSASLLVPEGYTAFQAVRGETSLVGGKKMSRVVGRVIGVVFNNEVIEEQFLNGMEDLVVGRRN